MTEKLNRNFERTLEVIRRHKKFFIGMHIFPDGDNIGSALALKFMFEQNGKSAFLYCETPIPKYYRWLKGSKEIHSELPEMPVSDFDVIIVVDSGDLKRLGRKFYEWQKDDKALVINIDHHISNEDYGDINWVDPTYAATGEQIYEVMKSLGTRVDIDIATAIFTALYTDTGRFSYSNTNARTLKYATELVEVGVKPHEIYRKVYASRSLAALRLEREVLETLVYEEDLNLAYMVMTYDMLERSGAMVEDSEGIMEHIGLFGESIRNYLLFKETAPNEIKVSVRSKGDWDASKVSALFGGGGHRGAGGFARRGAIKDVINESLNKIRKSAAEGAVGRDD